MEPPVYEEFDSVAHYVARMRDLRQQEEDPVTYQKRQVNCRVNPNAVELLERVAEELGQTRSTVAADLLELAIGDAAHQLGLGGEVVQRDRVLE